MVVDHNTIDNKLYHAVHYVLFQEQVSVRGDWDKLQQRILRNICFSNGIWSPQSVAHMKTC